MTVYVVTVERNGRAFLDSVWATNDGAQARGKVLAAQGAGVPIVTPQQVQGVA